MSEKYIIKPKDVDRVRGWLANRGGIAHWKSINLSNPGGSWSTPATIRRGDCADPLKAGEDPNTILPYPKPNWQCPNQPSFVTTSENDVIVEVPVEFKRFRISLRGSSNGLSLKLTDASTAKIRRGVDQAAEKTGKDAWYEFDYENQQAIIFVSGTQTPLKDYKTVSGN